MRSPGINGEGELRGQLANPGSPGKMAVKMVCVCVQYARHHCAEQINHGMARKSNAVKVPLFVKCLL